jgi:hypothetical protein
VRVPSLQSGTSDIGGKELPTVIYTVQFAVQG